MSDETIQENNELQSDVSEIETVDSLNNLAREDSDKISEFRKAKATLIPKPAEPEQIPEVKEFTAIEKEAIEMGWDPEGKKAKLEGKRALSADEFVERRSFYQKMDAQKQEILRLQAEQKKILEMSKKSAELAYNRAMADMTAKREELIREGNVKGFNELESKIIAAQQEHFNIVNEPIVEQKPNGPSVTSNLPPDALEAAESFKARNKQWFVNDTPLHTAMTSYAVTLEANLFHDRPELSHNERLTLVEEHVKENFPHAFKNPKQEQAPAVVTNSTKVSKKAEGPSAQHLSPAQKALGEQFVQRGVYKHIDEYAIALHKNGRLSLGERR